MILYFSATGNTEFIARELAKKLDDECTDLLPRIKAHDHSKIRSDKPWVICSPVYVCEMPRFLAGFLRQLEFEGCSDFYFVFVSAGYSGISGSLAKGIFRSKKMNVKGYADVVMPRNYPVSELYKLLDDEHARERIIKAYGNLEDIASAISSGEKLKHRYVFLFEKIITLPFNPVWSKAKFKTDDFYTNDNCIGCGICVKKCPLNNIALTDGKPSWGKSCTHCMACVGNCPKDAVEYGDIIKTKGKYHIRYHKDLLNELRNG